MSTVAKVFVVLNFLLAAVFLGSAASILGHSDNWKRRFDDESAKYKAEISRLQASVNEKQTQNEQLSRDKTVSDQERTKARQEADTLKTQNDSLRNSYDQLNAALATATRTAQVATASLQNSSGLVAELQKERQELINNLNKANEEKLAAFRMQSQLEENLAAIQTSSKSAEEKLSATAEALRQANFELEAWRVSQPGGGPGTVQPAQRGKVLVADAGANIIVISIGSEDGVKIGYRYTISRGNQFVATVEVTNVQAKQAAAKVILPGRVGPARAGDDIMTARN
jgi:hypothetical protein